MTFLKGMFGILSFTFLFATAAQAGVAECTDSLKIMTQLTQSYTDAVIACKELTAKGETGSRFYEGYRRIARDAERLHGQAQAVCLKECADTFFCEGKLEGACP